MFFIKHPITDIIVDILETINVESSTPVHIWKNLATTCEMVNKKTPAPFYCHEQVAMYRKYISEAMNTLAEKSIAGECAPINYKKMHDSLEHSGNTALRLIRDIFADPKTKELKAAILARNQANIKKAIASGADVNAADVNGFSPLAIATLTFGCDCAIPILLRAGAEDAPINDRPSALELAIRMDNFPAFTHLLHTCTPVNMRNKNGHTPFQVAAQIGAPLKMMDLLVKDGADVNALHPVDGTALHIATKATNVEMVKFLLDIAWIDVDLVNSDGETAYTYWRSRKCECKRESRRQRIADIEDLFKKIHKL